MLKSTESVQEAIDQNRTEFYRRLARALGDSLRVCIKAEVCKMAGLASYVPEEYELLVDSELEVLMEENLSAQAVALMVGEYSQATSMHSVPSGMRRSPVYRSIVNMGKAALPGIFRYMQDAGPQGVGMNVILLLMDILPDEDSPYQPEYEGGFAKFAVDTARRKWMEWGKQHNYIDVPEAPEDYATWLKIIDFDRLEIEAHKSFDLPNWKFRLVADEYSSRGIILPA